MMRQSTKAGFTLIETVIYMAIAIVMFTMIMSLYYALESARPQRGCDR